MEKQIWHSILIGGGASGLFCAGSYAAPKLLLEHNKQAGRKLNITGGGKCNFTNLYVKDKAYVCGEKHFCHAALAAFGPQDFVRLLEKAHISYSEKTQGQLFARNAAEITGFLIRRAKENHTEILCGCEVLRITKEHGLFCVQTSRGNYCGKNVVIASGGLSYPQLGASAFAWRAAKELGLETAAPRPALVSLALPSPYNRICRNLAGNSLLAEIRCAKQKERDMLLFTHDGISGPAVLQISLYWQEGEKILVNFLPDVQVQGYLQCHKNRPELFSKILSPFLPARILREWLGEWDVRAADAKKDALLAAARRLNAFACIPVGTGGFRRAEITAGGLNVKQFDARSMECKQQKGLFVIGEALDVGGRLGGFNLHWAWASAKAAAAALAARS